MRTLFAPRSIRTLLLFVLAVSCVPVFSAVASAADAPLQANAFFELVADRARLIQVSLVFVVIGIWLLWWRH